MKLLLPIILFLSIFMSCKKNDSSFPELQRCHFSDSEWFVDNKVDNIEGTTKLDTISNRLIISLKDRKQTGWEALIPCNMPNNFKIPDRNVRISGKIYSHPRLDYIYAPIELTAIHFSDILIKNNSSD